MVLMDIDLKKKDGTNFTHFTQSAPNLEDVSYRLFSGLE